MGMSAAAVVPTGPGSAGAVFEPPHALGMSTAMKNTEEEKPAGRRARTRNP
jgi:hypothetical protein